MYHIHSVTLQYITLPCITLHCYIKSDHTISYHIISYFRFKMACADEPISRESKKSMGLSGGQTQLSQLGTCRAGALAHRPTRHQGLPWWGLPAQGKSCTLCTWEPQTCMTRCVSSTGPGGSDHVGTRLLSPCQCKPLWRAEAPATKRPSQRAAGCSIPSMAWTLLSGCHAIVHESRPLKIPQFQTLTRNLSTDTWEAGGMSQHLHDICMFLREASFQVQPWLQWCITACAIAPRTMTQFNVWGQGATGYGSYKPFASKRRGSRWRTDAAGIWCHSPVLHQTHC